MTNIGAPVHWPVEQFRRGWIPGAHRGVDYGWRAAPNTARSKQILAVAAGRVESVTNDGGWNQGWGNRIWVQHTDRAATTYSHNRTGTATVSRGAIVSRGQVLATMGSTGDSTGDHLHFEVYIDGTRVNPAPYLAGTPLPGTPVVGGGGGFAQRTVRSDIGNPINGRVSPTTTAAVRQRLDMGTVGNFDQFIRGENVSQNGVTTNIWFRGAFAHNWFWSGNFTDRSTTGMADAGTWGGTTPTQQFVRIPEPYIWYATADDAARAVNRNCCVPVGDYPLIRVDARGPRLMQWDARQVWVGSTRTQPPIITK